MKTCLVLRHVAFEDLGTLASLLQHRGFEPRYLEVGVDRLERAEIDDSNILVVLGGPIGVYEEDEYPFLRRELALISSRLGVVYALAHKLWQKHLDPKLRRGQRRKLDGTQSN